MKELEFSRLCRTIQFKSGLLGNDLEELPLRTHTIVLESSFVSGYCYELVYINHISPTTTSDRDHCFIFLCRYETFSDEKPVRLFSFYHNGSITRNGLWVNELAQMLPSIHQEQARAYELETKQAFLNSGVDFPVDTTPEDEHSQATFVFGINQEFIAAEIPVSAGAEEKSKWPIVI